MTIEEWINTDIGKDIWNKKYRYNNETFDNWLKRITNSNEEYKSLILQKKFLPAGRILANRGLANKNKRLTYSNCYVSTPPEDNLESIFDIAKNIARTYSYGGGIGIDISKLRPNRARVNNAAKESSGAVSFMELYSMVTGLISQSGRRGALMLSINCNHPDIEEFINIKNDLSKVTKANISVKITDDFMTAVNEDKEFELKFVVDATGEEISRTVKARELFYKLCKNNWETGEPAMLFWDNISKWNLLSNDDQFKYAGTNPCAEEPLPAGGSCLLGSINLSELVQNNQFNFTDFEHVVRLSIRYLNEILIEGMPLHPLKEQRDSVNNWRQIGCGIMGLADMLIKLGIRYGSKESIELCDKIGFLMADTAIQESALIAKESGVYPKYSDKVLDSDFFICNTSIKTKALAREYGLANSQILTCAPTGTISTMLGISGGIEPIYAYSYNRKTESLHGEDKYYKIYTPIVKEYMDENGINSEDNLPSFFINAMLLNYHDRIAMQSIWQKHIDASISSTVNLPETATIEDVENIYIEAWRNGLKGITVFRDNCKRVGILTTKENNNSGVKFDSIVPVSRKKMGTTHGSTYCKKTACGTLYITLNRDDDGNLIECFVNTTKGGICTSNIGAVNRMVSLALRSGVKIEEIIDQLQAITCQACVKAKEVDGLSCPDILSRTLKEFTSQEKKIVNKNSPKCPECGNTISHSEGCVKCTNCGWSKC